MAARRSVDAPRRKLSPTCAPSVSAPARVIQAVPGVGMPAASRSPSPASIRKRPRNGKCSPNARTSPSRNCVAAAPLMRIMLWNSTVRACCNPGACAAVRNTAPIGASPRTTASPPSRRLASIVSARSARSVTIATAVTAITASTSAANRMRMSPDLKSRRSCRQASGSQFTRPPGGRHPVAGYGRSAPPNVRRGSPAPGWCRHPCSSRTAIR